MPMLKMKAITSHHLELEPRAGREVASSDAATLESPQLGNGAQHSLADGETEPVEGELQCLEVWEQEQR